MAMFFVAASVYQSRAKFLSFRFSFRNTNFSKFSVFKFLPSKTFEAVEKSLSTFVDVGWGVKYLLAMFERAVLILQSFPSAEYLAQKAKLLLLSLLVK